MIDKQTDPLQERLTLLFAEQAAQGAIVNQARAQVDAANQEISGMIASGSQDMATMRDILAIAQKHLAETLAAYAVINDLVKDQQKIITQRNLQQKVNELRAMRDALRDKLLADLRAIMADIEAISEYHEHAVVELGACGSRESGAVRNRDLAVVFQPAPNRARVALYLPGVFNAVNENNPVQIDLASI